MLFIKLYSKLISNWEGQSIFLELRRIGPVCPCLCLWHHQMSSVRQKDYEMHNAGGASTLRCFPLLMDLCVDNSCSEWLVPCWEMMYQIQYGKYEPFQDIGKEITELMMSRTWKGLIWSWYATHTHRALMCDLMKGKVRLFQIDSVFPVTQVTL